MCSVGGSIFLRGKKQLKYTCIKYDTLGFTGLWWSLGKKVGKLNQQKGKRLNIPTTFLYKNILSVSWAQKLGTRVIQMDFFLQRNNNSPSFKWINSSLSICLDPRHVVPVPSVLIRTLCWPGLQPQCCWGWPPNIWLPLCRPGGQEGCRLSTTAPFQRGFCGRDEYLMYQGALRRECPCFFSLWYHNHKIEPGDGRRCTHEAWNGSAQYASRCWKWTPGAHRFTSLLSERVSEWMSGGRIIWKHYGRTKWRTNKNAWYKMFGINDVLKNKTKKHWVCRSPARLCFVRVFFFLDCCFIFSCRITWDVVVVVALFLLPGLWSASLKSKKSVRLVVFVLFFQPDHAWFPTKLPQSCTNPSLPRSLYKGLYQLSRPHVFAQRGRLKHHAGFQQSPNTTLHFPFLLFSFPLHLFLSFSVRLSQHWKKETHVPVRGETH